MKLNRLCYILPADSDAKPAPPCINHHHPSATSTGTDKKERKQSPSPPPRKHGRSCQDQVGTAVTKLLRKIYRSANSHCCSAPRVDQFTASFHDAAGVDLQHTTTESHADNNNNNPRIFSYAELYIGTNGFNQEKLLGSGGFGRVYKAILPGSGTVVAVKCLAERGDHIEKTFMAELVAVAHLRHRNLVSLRGWCVHDDQLFLVYDYMPNSSLDRILFRSSSIPVQSAYHPTPDVLGWETRKRIVRGLAAALFYLHEQLEAQIIHRDVKASNVMLDCNFNARLGDFGLARWLEHELDDNKNDNHHLIQKTPSIGNHLHFRLTETTRIGGTIGYLPPESFQRRKYVATAKSDVFSFGVVALEVASGRRSVDLAYPDEQIILLDWVRRLADDGKVLKVGDPKLPKGSYGMTEMGLLIHLGLLCTLHNPKSRPTMRWVVEVLSGNVLGKLPELPPFKFHPLYISVSSSTSTASSKSMAAHDSATSTTTISTTPSTAIYYITASGKTLFITAEEDSSSNDASDSEEVSRGANRGSSKNSSERHQQLFNPFPLIETPREISYKELITATNNFSDDQRIAEVDFGTAYHGFLDNRLHVIVKRLGMKTCPALRARFSTELQNLGRLRHRNLIQLRGWCTEQGEMLVVYDYMASRLLSHLLFHHGHHHFVLTWNQRYSIIKSLASAILYLHEDWDEQVIHRHITSSSVILDPDMNPKLTSFALAEFLTRNEHGHHVETDKTKSARGIFGYMAAECMESGEANTAADVYSFGVVVMEVVTGQMAVDFRRPEVLLVQRVREFVLRRRAVVEELADRRMDGDYDGEEFKRVMRLALACTHSNAEARPSIRQIVSVLDGNDLCFVEFEGQKEKIIEWRQRNGSALSLVRRIQALGIQ